MRVNRPFTFSILSLCTLALVSCGGQPPEEARPKAEPEAAEPIAEHMGEHFEQVTAAQRAIIRGDLEGVRNPSQWLAEHQAVEGLPEGWQPYVDEMRSAAQLAGEARTFAAAASATASMVQACGKCHTGVGAEPRVPELGAKGLPPADQIDTVPHMLRHQWAVEQMWIGLINPSEDSWNKGAEVLADAPLEPQKVTDDAGLTADVGGWAQTVHEVGAKAPQAADWGARAELYGELLATCARCHQKLALNIALE